MRHASPQNGTTPQRALNRSKTVPFPTYLEQLEFSGCNYSLSPAMMSSCPFRGVKRREDIRQVLVALSRCIAEAPDDRATRVAGGVEQYGAGLPQEFAAIDDGLGELMMRRTEGRSKLGPL